MSACSCVCVYVRKCVHMCVCVCLRECMRVRMHMCAYVCVRECLHMGVCARARGFCAYAGARAGAHTCLREYVRVCENVHMLCVRARVSACRCASVGGLAYKRLSSIKFIIGSSIRLHPITIIKRYYWNV